MTYIRKGDKNTDLSCIKKMAKNISKAKFLQSIYTGVRFYPGWQQSSRFSGCACGAVSRHRFLAREWTPISLASVPHGFSTNVMQYNQVYIIYMIF